MVSKFSFKMKSIFIYSTLYLTLISFCVCRRLGCDVDPLDNLDFNGTLGIDSIVEMPDGLWVVFEDQYYYEMGVNGLTLKSGRLINNDFQYFNESRVDASLVYDNIIYLFYEKLYYKYEYNENSNHHFITKDAISRGFTGLPDGTFDDAFVWNVNQKTYFFKGGQYYKYDSKQGKVVQGPKEVSKYWKGIPDTFDAAISSRTRNMTLFFKNKKYYRFDDNKKKVVETIPPFPREFDIWFLKCRNLTFERRIRPKFIKQNETLPDIRMDANDQNSLYEYWLIGFLGFAFILIIICIGLLYIIWCYLPQRGAYDVQRVEEIEMTERAQPVPQIQPIGEKRELDTEDKYSTPPQSQGEDISEEEEEAIGLAAMQPSTRSDTLRSGSPEEIEMTEVTKPTTGTTGSTSSKESPDIETTKL